MIADCYSETPVVGLELLVQPCRLTHMARLVSQLRSNIKYDLPTDMIHGTGICTFIDTIKNKPFM